MFIDTHCHISQEDYDNIDFVIKENIEAGIDKIVVSLCSKESIEEGIEFPMKYPMIYLTLGYHPEEVLSINDQDLETLKQLLLSTPHVVGIGEIGLDYHYDKSTREEQILLFKKQLALAEELHLPVVIHSRDATKDTIEILKQFSVRGIIHCFSGSYETAKIYQSMGFYLGIGGVVTFQNSNLVQVVEKIGLDFIVLETDSPYLTPHPFRGRKNSSKYIPVIAEKIAEACNTDLQMVAEITTDNAVKVFDFT